MYGDSSHADEGTCHMGGMESGAGSSPGSGEFSYQI
jgi:hypothetical protein